MTTSKTPRRRRSRGNAWHWRQTDCWYYTPPSTKRRVRLTDEDGLPIRGREQRRLAELALARVKSSGNWRPTVEEKNETPWLVAAVCSRFIEHCGRRAEIGGVGPEYRDEVARYLNDFCGYCGALSVAELRKGHVLHWVESHSTWNSPATRRNAITVVLSAFNYAQETNDVRSPLHGLKKPPQRPRLQSFGAEDERLLYQAADEPFGDFLYAAIRTGLRPFCELARLTTKDIVETDRGMMWRVFSSKTKKTRKIPVRAEVAALTRRLAIAANKDSDSTLFRNTRGRPWKKGAGVSRFLKIKRDLGWDHEPVRRRYSCYTCRHTFAHRMLAGYWNNGNGCSVETLAELMGDTPKVAFDHYGKEWGRHYQEPLWAAIGVY